MLERHGAEVISAAEENGDGPVAEYLRGNLALIAELERGPRRQGNRGTDRRQTVTNMLSNPVYCGESARVS
jgi:hypothetical protein